mgnify:CR=1 FL=1
MKKEIVLYGAGKRCQDLCCIIRDCGIDVKCIVDNDANKAGGSICGYLIETPDALKRYNGLFCITIQDSVIKSQVRNMLFNVYKYEQSNEIGYFDLLIYAYCHSAEMKNIIEKAYIPTETEFKVVFTCGQGFTLGGIEAWVESVAVALVEDGFGEIYVAADNSSYEIPSVLEGRIERIPINHILKFSKNNIFKIVLYLLQCLPCTVVINKIDEVMLAAVILKKHFPTKIKIISVIHNGTEDNYSQNFELKNYIELYVAVSKDIVTAMRKRGIEERKIRHMTCPVQCQRQLNRSYTLDISQSVILGFAGRLEKKQKRMDLLLKLVEELEYRKINYKCIIAGDGTYKDIMTEFIVQHGLNDRVILIGSVERKNIPLFWKEIDICINISDFEGRSISIMEAMANGAVPVVTETSGVHEDIKDGENGFIVGIGDYKKIVEKVVYLEKNRELLPIMGRISHELIYSKGQMKEHVRVWKEILIETYIL